MKKKALSLLLALTMALGLCAVRASALGVFPDVSDAETAKNVEILYALGVINGDGAGNFNPDKTLSRAEFTKMAVELVGEGDDVATYRTTTIFPDLRASHWAAGHVNLAVRKLRLINGLPDGTFAPDKAVTFGEAVTILMRLLGYTDADAGAIWPDGYLNLAAGAKLTEGLSLSGTGSITRAQAAKLFVNALSAAKKDGGTLADGIGTVRSTVIVAADGSDAGFAALAGRGDYLIVRSGMVVTADALRKNDVAYYDETSNTVRVGGTCVAAYYLSAYPSAEKPEKIRLSQLSGGDDGYLEVLPGARSAMAACRTGEVVTLLLTDDGKVAGVVSDGSAQSTLVGCADENGMVTLFGGLSTSMRVSDRTLYGSLVRVLPGSGSGIRFEAFDLSAANGTAAYRASDGSKLVTLTIGRCTAATITASDAAVYSVASGAALYDSGEQKSYDDGFHFLRSGTATALVLNSRDEVTAVYADSAAQAGAVVISGDGVTSGLDAVAGRTDYSIYKNGERITAANLKKDDVAVYHRAGNTFRVSSLRVRAYYTDAAPGLTAPERAALEGLAAPTADGMFPVLASAQDAVAACRVGKAYTFLLTEDYRIAGVRESGAGNLIGYVDETGGVELFSDIEATAVSVPARLRGTTVSVTAADRSGLEAKALATAELSGDLDTVNGRIGSRVLAADVRIYEKVGKSALTALSLDELPDSVANEKIVSVHLNDMGRVDVLVLENVIGKGMIYGRITAGRVMTDESTYNTVISVDTPDGAMSEQFLCAAFGTGETAAWGGIIPAAKAENVGSASYRKVTAYVVLRGIEKVPTAAFRSERLLSLDGAAYAVDADVVCYNAVTGTWFSSLSAALSYAGQCTVYVDADNIVRAIEVYQ